MPIRTAAPRDAVRVRIEFLHSCDHTQTCPHSSLRIVFMRLGIAKVDEQAIAEILRNVPLQTLDHRGACGLVGADDLTAGLRVELARQGRGVHQIAEQHRELTALGI